MKTAFNAFRSLSFSLLTIFLTSCSGNTNTAQEQDTQRLKAEAASFNMVGEGILSRDSKKAAELFKKACDLGNLDGCTNLGLLYKTGNGVPQDIKEADRLFYKACDCSYAGDMQRSPKACRILAQELNDGSGSLTKNPDAGRDFLIYGCGHAGNADPATCALVIDDFDKRCKAGDGQSCTNYGNHFELGIGVPVDLQKAKDAYKKACSLKDESGCELLESLK